MASYHNLPEHTRSRTDSPARVFAKLKSRVQKEAMCAKEGVFTHNHLPYDHRAALNSPRETAEDTWMTEALTISPISSPQKTFSAFGSKHVEKRPVGESRHTSVSRHGHTPRKGSFRESTTLSYPLSVRMRDQINAYPTRVRDIDDYIGTYQTPVKLHPVQQDYIRCEVEDECAPQDKVMSPAKVYSPMKKRLRKRKREQEFNKVSNSTNGDRNEVMNQSLYPILTDNIHNIASNVQGRPAEQLENTQYTRSTAEKRFSAITESFPVMSPAKMFAFMKERESKRGKQEVQCTRQLFTEGKSGHSRDIPLSTRHNMEKRDNLGFRSVTESVVPAKHSRAETTDTQGSSSEDGLDPVVQSQPAIFEDPLVLNSPEISIQKKHRPVFKRKILSHCEKFPDESVIYLKQWFLRRTSKGLFVDGIRRDENIPWNSNIVVDRVSNFVLKTVSGRVYILVGKMKLGMKSEFPNWFLKKFFNGFPLNWKMLYEKFILESRDNPRKESDNIKKGRKGITKKKPEASSINASIKQQRQKSLKTSDSSPPTSSDLKVSRSGRIIKPPLEYWKGGRVIVDAFMNVTIHEGYNTSVCIPEPTVSARKSLKPVCVLIPRSEGRKFCESASKEEVSGPRRKVKATCKGKRTRAKIDPEDSSLDPPQPSVEENSSPEQLSVRKTSSSPRCPATKKTPLNGVPQKQRVRKKASKRLSKEHTQDTERLAVNQRKQTVAGSPESVAEKQQLSDGESFVKRTRQRKGLHRKRSGKANPNHPSPSSRSSETSEEKGMTLRKRTKICDAAQTQKKSNKTPPATNPLAKSVQSTKKPKVNKNNRLEEDEDKWTEVELAKLQTAASHYPKHMMGYWEKVARMVRTRSAAECHMQWTSQGTSQTPTKKATKSQKETRDAAKVKATDHPLITAGVGTFKRKQQVRQFLDAMPKEDVDDIFSSAYMQSKRFEIPYMCPNDDHDFPVSDMKLLTPTSKLFPEVKTPQCLHITPGMMGSPNRNDDDKYVFQLQKRMKKNQFNVCKNAPSTKSFTPTPSAKRTMRRCENTEHDAFVVWEMFPGKDALLESEEDEDFYFSDNA